jgi:hypothetical protein
LGLEAGVFGGLAMTAFLILVYLLHGRPWWLWPNVLATALYRGQSLGRGPDWHTVSGFALQVLMTGIVGALFGTTFPQVPASARLVLLGLLWGLAWYFLSASLFRQIAPLVAIASPGYAMLAANLIFGACLGCTRTENEGDGERRDAEA